MLTVDNRLVFSQPLLPLMSMNAAAATTMMLHAPQFQPQQQQHSHLLHLNHRNTTAAAATTTAASLPLQTSNILNVQQTQQQQTQQQPSLKTIQQLLPPGCPMEKTKLSVRQIRHALPGWMFDEIMVDVAVPPVSHDDDGDDLFMRTSNSNSNGCTVRSVSRAGSASGEENDSGTASPLNGSMNAGERKGKKTRRGCRAKRHRDSATTASSSSSNTLSNSSGSGSGSMSPLFFPEADMQALASGVVPQGASLSRCIAALPADLQRCFTEWRRERKQAILLNQMDRQRDIERIMWSALHNIVLARRSHYME